jgi:hypothetical protein
MKNYLQDENNEEKLYFEKVAIAPEPNTLLTKIS